MALWQPSFGGFGGTKGEGLLRLVFSQPVLDLKF
jgi:hypothetical protein